MTQPRAFPYHYESRALLNVSAKDAYTYLDDFRKLSAHMERPSTMMLGSKMQIETDEGEGRTIGSRVRMHGAIFGMELVLEEVVTERKVPLRKVWETVDAKLLVIGQYRLGFELEPKNLASSLRVFIDYELPANLFARWLGFLFGRIYARWCTVRMARDAIEHFRGSNLG